jgi:hypothetical protein
VAKYYELEVSLKDIAPRLWRRFQLPAAATFAELHESIQQAFGWLSYHLWGFRAPGRHGGVIAGLVDHEGFDDEPTPDAERVKLSAYFADEVGERCIYTYDFGDDWLHEVKLTRVFEDASGFRRRLVAGKRAGPPEDCGGPFGYARMVTLATTGKDPEGDDPNELLEWLGGWQPEAFDLAQAKKDFDLEASKAKKTAGASKRKTSAKKDVPAAKPIEGRAAAGSARAKLRVIRPEAAEPDRLRAALLDLPKERLVELVLSMMREKTPLSATTGRAKSTVELKGEIGQVLAIGFVDWREVSDYIDQLYALLSEITALGEQDPPRGLALMWHFLEEIPRIFDRVHDEDELAIFCEELIAKLLDLMPRAQTPAGEAAQRLLGFYLGDTHGRFLQIPALLRERVKDQEARREISAVAAALAEKAGADQARELRALAVALAPV